MIQVKVDGRERHYPDGTLLKTVAEDVQDGRAGRILLAVVNGKLRELSKTAADGTEYCVFHVDTDPEHPSQDRRMCFCPIVFEKGRIRQL